MKKIVTVLGARPQFIKAAVLSRIIKEMSEIEEIIIHTGQHFDENMSDVFFQEMQIPKPKYNLNVNNLSHGAMTGRMLEEIEKTLVKENPDAVVVYGDTNSTLAGVLAAKKLHIKTVHIEAGLRSFNMKMPEEVNRILTDRISDLLSCPTQTAVNNLKLEGYDNLSAIVEKHGDIMKDAVDFYSDFSSEKSSIISNLNLTRSNFVLATIHRQENTNDSKKLNAIFNALDNIYLKKPVILPLHPRTKEKLKEYKVKTKVKLIDPVGYFDMLELLKNCSLVITDSGGLQKESYFNKKPCVVLREETEWSELVNYGYATLVGSNTKKIIQSFSDFSLTQTDFSRDLYGSNVGEKIYNSILSLIEA